MGREWKSAITIAPTVIRTGLLAERLAGHVRFLDEIEDRDHMPADQTAAAARTMKFPTACRNPIWPFVVVVKAG